MSFENLRRLRKPLQNLFGKQSEKNLDSSAVQTGHTLQQSNSSGLNNQHETMPTIYSYYADFQNDGYYQTFAKQLISRCEGFGVHYNISERASRGSYKANCLMKPEFILEKLIESKSPLIWMDCDTDFREPFSEFNNVSEDIGMATHSGDLSGIKASPLFFNYTSGAFRIIREWVVHCRAAYIKNIEELDHDALKHYVLPHLRGKYSIFLLSSNWNDFVHGRYLSNGNSKVDGKMETHRQVSVEDHVRATYSNGTKTFHVYFRDNSESVFKTAEDFLDNFSNYSRLFFHFKEDLEKYSRFSEFKRVSIESGGNFKFGMKDFKNHTALKDEIVLDVFNVKSIQKGWDTLIQEEILSKRNPLHSLNFKDGGKGFIKIKNYQELWD